jgi:hypothetical protein
MTSLLAMTKPLSGIHPIAVGGSIVLIQKIMFYAFNFTKPLQHISPHTNLKLQLRVVVK